MYQKENLWEKKNTVFMSHLNRKSHMNNTIFKYIFDINQHQYTTGMKYFLMKFFILL